MKRTVKQVKLKDIVLDEEEKINNLYQSQNKNMGGKGLLWMALIFAVLSCYFFIPNIFSEGVIDRVIFRYLIT